MSKLLLDSNPLIIIPELAVAIGLNESIILQQLHYWLQKSTHNIDGRIWVYNSIPQWMEQFPFFSKPTLERAMASLKSKGLIITANYNKMKIDRTLWYSIDYETLKTIEVHNKKTSKSHEQTCHQNDVMVPSKRWDDTIKMTSPLPEITTETTTERSNQSVSQSNNSTQYREEEKTKDRLTDPITLEKEVKEIIINAQVELYDSKNFIESIIRKLYTDSNMPYTLKMGLTHSEIQERLKLLAHIHIDRGLFKLGEAQKGKGVKNKELYFAKCLLTSIVEAQIDFLGLEEDE